MPTLPLHRRTEQRRKALPETTIPVSNMYFGPPGKSAMRWRYLPISLGPDSTWSERDLLVLWAWRLLPRPPSNWYFKALTIWKSSKVFCDWRFTLFSETGMRTRYLSFSFARFFPLSDKPFTWLTLACVSNLDELHSVVATELLAYTFSLSSKNIEARCCKSVHWTAGAVWKALIKSLFSAFCPYRYFALAENAPARFHTQLQTTGNELP